MSAASSGPRRVFLIRHGEKPSTAPHPGGGDGGRVDGVQENGSPNPHSLTPRGWQRAGALAVLLAPADGSVRAGLAMPTRLIAPDYGSPRDAAVHRPWQTVAPLSARLGVRVEAPVADAGDGDGLARHVLGLADETVLVCWDHQNIPALVTAFVAAVTVSPVPVLPAGGWPADRFDTTLTFTREESRHEQTPSYRFAEQLQLLLPGDSPQGICLPG